VVEPVGVRSLSRRSARGSSPLNIPASLEWWRRVPGGAEWLDRLPRLVSECAEEWSLRVGEPYDSHVSFVARAERDDGTPAVLKLNVPEVETEHEADALSVWPDDASVQLLEWSRERSALLVERCDPGTQLWERPEDEALGVACELFPKLWRAGDPGPPFRRIADEATTWAQGLSARPLERTLLDAALAALEDLPRTQGELVLCNEDFHGGNVLRSRRGWLAIDPKPIVAEREFGVVSLIRDRRPVDSATIIRRLDTLAELGLDRDRMRRWSLVHALWWSADDATGELHPDLVEAARLLL
jgi:streptomycin 6-kinase